MWCFDISCAYHVSNIMTIFFYKLPNTVICYYENIVFCVIFTCSFPNIKQEFEFPWIVDIGLEECDII